MLSRVSVCQVAIEEEGGGSKKKHVKRIADIRLRDDVGAYVCGFHYPVSMLRMRKRSVKSDVAFLHVPDLEGDTEVSVGVRVTVKLISTLVGVWEQKSWTF